MASGARGSSSDVPMASGDAAGVAGSTKRLRALAMRRLISHLFDDDAGADPTTRQAIVAWVLAARNESKNTVFDGWKSAVFDTLTCHVCGQDNHVRKTIIKPKPAAAPGKGGA